MTIVIAFRAFSHAPYKNSIAKSIE